ncbi:hypothetical protein BGW42_001075 [Actinomortierella wolfii]|nr:hypothetical protein BGW42_001075 [Actinomortierella wolfii]
MRQPTRPIAGPSSHPLSGKVFIRRNTWTPQVIKPRNLNLKRITTFEECGRSEHLKRCMDAQGMMVPDAIDHEVFLPLVEGWDVLIQVRGKKLREYVALTLVDAMGTCVPEDYAVVLVNSHTTPSTRRLVKTLVKYLEDAGLSINVKDFAGDKTESVTTHSMNIRGVPTIFICTPTLFEQLVEDSVLKPKHHSLLVMYEAEYILGRTSAMLPRIAQTIKAVEPDQLVVAAMSGSTAVSELPDKLEFHDEGLVYSMDHCILSSSKHFFFKENSSVEDKIFTRVLEIGQRDLAIVICNHNDTARVKKFFEGHIAVYSLDNSNLTAGVILTTRIAPYTAFRGLNTGCVRMVVNLLSNCISSERYLDMASTFIAIGKECDIVIKISKENLVTSIESQFGITMTEITTSQNPFAT